MASNGRYAIMLATAGSKAMAEIESNMTRYMHLMNELKMRLRMLEGQLAQDPTANTFENEDVLKLEIRCLQLRKVLELLVFSSLTAHQRGLVAIKPDLSVFWKAKTLLTWLGKQNPMFFPVALDVKGGVDTTLHFDHRSGPDIFTIEEFAPLFDACSEALHVANPFAPTAPINLGRTFTDWIDRIRSLLSPHMVALDDDEVFIVNMLDWDRPGVEVYRAKGE